MGEELRLSPPEETALTEKDGRQVTLGRAFVRKWVELGPRFLPFADVATEDLPLGRLFRLSLFQVSVGMALVLLVGTLNRVMIVELGVPASVVGIVLAVPLVAAPFRALIGFRSDHHRSELGWRRVPFIWKGTLIQFGGFAIMPFALLVLAGRGEAANAPAWIGQGSAALAALLVGVGVHTVQTAGLALATDLTPVRSHPRVVGLMYVMLLLGMFVSALVFGRALEDFSPGRLVQVIQGAALATLVLNTVAMWKQEVRRPRRGIEAGAAEPDPTFLESWQIFRGGQNALPLLWIIGIGTLAFGMADVLLEPFGGQILGMAVADTTRLTALFALGGLLGFGLASAGLGSGLDPHRLTLGGTAVGGVAFLAILFGGTSDLRSLFALGNLLLGFGAALFAHGTLTTTMNSAPKGQVGLALGAWGSVQATAAGVAIAVSGMVRDLVQAVLGPSGGLFGLDALASSYVVVFSLELTLLGITMGLIFPLTRA